VPRLQELDYFFGKLFNEIKLENAHSSKYSFADFL
jgi:hypothetical protein